MFERLVVLLLRADDDLGSAVAGEIDERRRRDELAAVADTADRRVNVTLCDVGSTARTLSGSTTSTGKPATGVPSSCHA